MQRHILVAVGSSHNTATLTAGISLAKEWGAFLTALHVHDRMPSWALLAAEHDFGITLSMIEDNAQDVVRQADKAIQVSGVAGEAKMIPLPLKGSTLDMAIADTARQLGVDLVIVGAQSKSKWRFFRRRLSERVRDRLENIVVMAPEQVDQAMRETSLHLRSERSINGPSKNESLIQSAVAHR